MERGQGRSVGFRDLPPEDAEQGTEPLLPESAFAQDGDSPQPKIRGGVLRDKHGGWVARAGGSLQHLLVVGIFQRG